MNPRAALAFIAIVALVSACVVAYLSFREQQETESEKWSMDVGLSGASLVLHADGRYKYSEFSDIARPKKNGKTASTDGIWRHHRDQLFLVSDDRSAGVLVFSKIKFGRCVFLRDPYDRVKLDQAVFPSGVSPIALEKVGTGCRLEVTNYDNKHRTRDFMVPP